MIRRVIQIEEDKCNGCGACAKACHEGAIGMVNGKAKLMRDDYCDGLGIAFRHVRWMRFILLNGKRKHMTRRQC
mgnify:FL=1